MTNSTRVQKLSSGCTRAQRCLGITSSADGKMVFEAQGDCVVVRSTKTGEVLYHLRSTETPVDPNTNITSEKLRLRVRNQHIRAHFENRYKNPHLDDADVDVAAHKASWVSRQVDKFVIPADYLSHVTSVALHPTQSGQLFVATADHLLRLWDIAQGTVLDTYTLDAPAVWMQASHVDPSQLLIVLNETARMDRGHAVALSKEAKENKKKDAAAAAAGEPSKGETKPRGPKWTLNLHGLETSHWKLISFNLTKGAVEDELFARKFMPFYGASLQHRHDAHSSDYMNAIALIASNQLYYIRVGIKNTGDVAPRKVDIARFEHVRQFACVTIHPTYDEVVTGDSMGQMQVWRQLNKGKGHVQPAKLHWHAHRVGCVAYSRDGSFVASGGEEFVLVLWHLESGRRQYMPRLSAALTGIATKADGSGYLVACQDNSILSFNPVTNAHEWQMGGLGRVGLSANKTLIARRLAIEPWSNTLAVQSKSLVGQIQFYNPLHDRVVGSVALTQRNQVSRTDDEAPIRTYAAQVCFSKTARTMATVTTTLDECVLRFWTRKSDGSFTMHTDVDMPHGDHVITSMAAHGKYVVTADNRGEFRLWQDNATTAWTCRSLAQFRDVAIGAVAFSDDGSLLAVAYGSLLTLWDPDTNVLQSVLAYPKTPIKDILFSPHTPHVVVRTECGFYVWSLLTCTVSWFYTLPVAAIALSPAGALVVAIVTKPKTLDVTSHVITFDLATPLPTAIDRLPQVEAAAVVFYKNQLVVMDHVSHVYRVGGSGDVAADDEGRALAADTTTILKQMYGSLKVQEKPDVATAVGDDAAAAVHKSLFEAPAHVLPPLRSLYRSFLDTMLKAKNDDDADASHKTNGRYVFDKPGSDEVATTPKAKKQKLMEEKPEDTYAALKKVFSKK
ncbi:Aste57867_9138 [Aphanomyces stellatus]|uniref:Aste57867_9138 protein n=1 Tax=Aphanomyces stellatus TaxID=120398 RepID=A0A485KM18_9STRA|nr:hypothetical protein As57867_009102 [Aphanomyces stellatus]VFT86022.1 Aste57867_9138 [Aphanomyces stellatus]